MATSNVSLTTTWAKVAEDSDDPVLVQAVAGNIEIAATATDSAPAASLRGHRLSVYESASRMVVGDGFYWARASDTFAAATLVVSK